MGRYFLRRVILIIPTLILITVLISGLVRLLPGDAVDVFADQYRGTAADIEAAKQQIRERIGLDRSWPEQYLDWVWGVLRGDFGHSLQGSERSVLEDLAPRLPVTFELGAFGILVGVVIALPIGVYSAVRQDTTGDYVARSFAIMALAIPTFWSATLIIAVVFPKLGLPPLPISYRGLFNDPLQNLRQMYVPAIILGVALAGPVMRLTRAQMLEVMRQDYVRTARAKGLRERNVIARHAMRNALIPVITLIGLQVPIIIGGSVVLESIFVLPGMGLRLLRALSERDIPVILGINLIIAAVVVAANLIVDMTYALLDPRIRYS